MREFARRLLPPILVDLLRDTLRSSDTAAVGRSHATYHDEFVEFISRRRDIALTDAQRMVACAEEQFTGGWGGGEYRKFTELALESLRPLYDDTTDSELIDTYKFHGPVDFLRMLSYAVPSPLEIAPIVRGLSGRKDVHIVDYGCGLAHRTIAVSRALIAASQNVRLTLVDIRRAHHFEFLDFLCAKYGIDRDFIEVTSTRMYPNLPAHDYCDIVSVLEHLPQPLIAVEQIGKTLRAGGVLLASTADELPEMMHVSPNLEAVRSRLTDLKFERAGECCGATLFRRGLSSTMSAVGA